VKKQQSTSNGSVKVGRWTAGDDEQRESAADDEGSDEEGEGRNGDGDGDEGGGRATAKRVKKRVSAARARATAMAMATWVAGNEEGEGNGGKGDGDEGEGRRRGRWQRRQRGRWQRRRGWRVTERGIVMAATAMEAAMKASDGNEGDGKGNSGGWRAMVTRVKGKGRWRGRQERSRRQKERGGGAKSCKRTNAVGGGYIDDVESSGPSRLAAMAEASTRLPSGDVEAGAVFKSGSYCGVGL
jgi:hypothetical protein